MYKKYSKQNHIWQHLWNLCWDAHMKQTNVIAACITDSEDNILSSGQNTIYLKDYKDTYLDNTCIAHAEMNAIYNHSKTINKFPQKDYILYSTIEPCAMCFGAMVMSGIRNVVYGARDYYGGAVILNDSTEFIKDRNISVTGPVVELEAIIRTLHGVSFLSKGQPMEYFLTKHIKYTPNAAIVAREIIDSGLVDVFERDYTPEMIFDYIVDRLNDLE